MRSNRVPLLKRLTSRLDPLRPLVGEVLGAVRNRESIALHRRAQSWIHGFFADKVNLYDFERFGHGAYVTDYQRHVKSDDLNSPYQYVLGDKFVAHHVLQGIGAPVPTLFAVIEHGRFIANDLESKAALSLDALLRQVDKVAIKPRTGSGGIGFAAASLKNGVLHLNEAPAESKAPFQSGAYLVSQFVSQSTYAANLFSRTTNTLRVCTMWDHEREEPFVAFAVQRIGTSTSFPVDNWGAGGLSADVDIETGVLGRAATKPKLGKPVWHDVHPETGAQIAGVQIPNWQAMTSELVKIAKRLPGMEYLGWDVAMTPDGIAILEANNRTDVNLVQVHRPLLLNKRISDFYRRRNVL